MKAPKASISKKVKSFLRCAGRKRVNKIDKVFTELNAKRASAREAALSKGREAVDRMNTELASLLEPRP